MTGGYRVTPAQGLQIDEVHVPGDINVFVPSQVIQRDPRYFEKPLDFMPERWSDKRGQLTSGNIPYMPFSLGTPITNSYEVDNVLTSSTGAYSCPGKNLALMVLRSAVSRIALQFDIAFAPGETGQDFDLKAMDTFTTTLPPLRLQFSPRQSK